MNELLANFHFLRPWAFLALLPAFVLFWYLRQHQQHASQWTNLIHPKLLPYLLDGEISRQQRWPLLTLLALWIMATLALAGPVWEQKPQPVQKSQSAMVILWDMSLSMLAQDTKPSRLARARLKLDDLLDNRKEGLTALIVYSGDAHVVTPLTDDVRTIKTMLPGLEPRMMPSMGSNAEAALELAHTLLADSAVSRGDIVYLTDGISPSAFANLEGQMKNSRHRLFVWGIGTPEGAPIPLPLGGFAKRQNGEIVVAQLNERALSDAAISMGGLYVPFDSLGDEDIATLQAYTDNAIQAEHASKQHLSKQHGSKQHESNQSVSSRLFDQWEEQGHWLVLLMLPFVALAFRRGWLLCICVFSTLGMVASPNSHALEWQDLWQNKNQQGQALLEADQPEAAANTFENPTWKGIAHFRAGDLQAAAEQFARAESAMDQYNLGTTLTFQGDYESAIAAFDNALQLKPDFNEAKENRQIAKKLQEMAKQQEQNQQSGEQSDQQSDQQSEQQQNQDAQDKQSQSAQNQSGEGQQSQDQSQDQTQDQTGQKDDQNTDETASGEPSDSQQMSEEQQQALDQAYNKPDADEQAQQQAQEASDEEPTDVSPEQQALQQGQEADDSEQAQQEQQDQQSAAYMQMTEAEKEQQQALEQWLRRVPDDPSGLLRNKFNYEYQQRQRETQSRRYNSPDSSASEDRW